MSTAGPNPERQANKMDTNTTHAGEYKNSGDTNSAEEVPFRFSSDQASPTDNPYDNAPSQQSIPSKSHSNSPSSQAELQEQIGEDARPHYNIPKSGDAWQKCYEMAEKHDNEMCDVWKDEVDKLLIFAGLFSGAVTAFTTQSYQWLGEQSVDSSARLLNFIALQFANSTNPLPPSLAVPEFTVTQAQIRINVVWFLSLTLSLTTLLIGILCLQWLREFQRVAALPHKDAFALRQMRYEGLIHWRVPTILSTLPLLLQLSLILFFVGLLDLLWSLNTLVAACVSAVVSIVMIFLVTTTALPALQHAMTKNKHLRIAQCPYKSPQSWLFYRTGQWLFDRTGQWLFWLINSFASQMRAYEFMRFARLRKSFDDTNWLTYDMRWRRLRDAKTVSWGAPLFIRDSYDVVNGLRWINDTFPEKVEAVFSVYHSLGQLDTAAATTTILGFYGENHTFRAMMEQPTRTETQKRDVVAAYYLKLHKDLHPVLKTRYVETVIRILNTQDVPRPLHGWLSNILLDLLFRPRQMPLLALSVPGATTQSNTDKLTIQALLCVKSLIARDLLHSLEDVCIAWDLLRRLLIPPPSPPVNLKHSTDAIVSEPLNRGLGLNLDHIELASSLFEELKEWLPRGKETDRRKRVTICAEGMIRLFHSSIDIAALNTMCPVQMGTAAEMVRALDVHMWRLGGAGAVLGREWKYWRRGISEEELCEVSGEWAFLVNRFEGLEINNG